MLNACAPVVPTLEHALAARFTGFVSFLRENGFRLGLDDAAALVNLASRIGVFDVQVLRWSARALLCRRADDRDRFDELFDAWFLPPNRRQFVENRGTGHGALDRRSFPPGPGGDDSEGMPVAAANDDDSGDGLTDGSAAQRRASEEASLAEADFRHLNRPDDIRKLDALMRDFAR
ncbi:hypothetical protein, partial [Rudaea sp.]|uniref:hypothetical protein n=1 Tax=Rudaea sp. TaxID=2136325 RepID=UPI002ECFCB6D